jgi:hypothetical protein
MRNRSVKKRRLVNCRLGLVRKSGIDLDGDVPIKAFTFMPGRE